MKSAADPYEFFRWKSSCGRLVVRTTWVKGVRHVVLSDDDDAGRRPEKSGRQPRHQQRKNTAAGNGKSPAPGRPTPPGAAHCANNENHEPPSCNCGHRGDGDESYAERVLQWLQKPSGELDTRRKPMSAPGHGVRRPALIKTFSIPEDRFADQQVVEADCRGHPTKYARNRAKIHNQKTELHVHMPSVCPTANDDGNDVNNDY